MLKTTIQFTTGNGKWWLDKTFNDEKHMDNFINYITRTKGYFLDELYIH